MPAWIAERYDSRPSSEGEDNRTDLIFVVRGTDDEAEVRSIVKLNAPPMYADLSLVQIDSEPMGGDLWYATARYQLIEFPSDYEFDTSGGTQRISTSLATLQRLSVPGYQAPNYQGAIGVTEDRVEGVDITVPVFNFSETKYLDTLTVTPEFKYNLFLLTGKVNNATFKGYAKGELLFLGATGSKRGRERWAITYKFAASPNVVDQPIGDGGLVISKEGWQYLWVRFVDDEDPTAKALIKRPVAAYVEQVYPYGDFSVLGIGA